MKRLLAISASALCLTTSPAFALIETTGETDDSLPDLVVGSTVLGITGEFAQSESIDYSESFLAGPIAGSADLDIGIINSDGTPAGFDNLDLQISSSAGSFMYDLTEDVDMGSAGDQLLEFVQVAIAPGEMFTVALMGDAFTPGTSSAFLSLQFSANPIPLPGAAPLLLTALGGLGLARARRKKAG